MIDEIVKTIASTFEKLNNLDTSKFCNPIFNHRSYVHLQYFDISFENLL